MRHLTIRFRPGTLKINFDPLSLAPEDLNVENAYGVSFLARLTLAGLLPKVPLKFLSPDLVLSQKKYIVPEMVDYKMSKRFLMPDVSVDPKVSVYPTIYPFNFLLFCAATGHFLELPRQYQTREHLITVREDDWLSPLDAAIQFGRVHLLPLDVLKPMDISPKQLTTICLHEQVNCIEHLVTSENVTTDVLSFCIKGLYFPEAFEKYIIPEKVLARDDEMETPLTQAATVSCLDRFVVDRFVSHYDKVSEQLKKWKYDLSVNPYAPNHPAFEEPKRKADIWLAELSKLVHAKANP